MDVKLVMFREDGSRRDFPIPAGVTTIGRKEDCGIRIPLSIVSRRHAEILLEDDAVVLRDLGAANGTYLNNRRVTEEELEAGDQIMIGPVVVPASEIPDPQALRLRTILNGEVVQEAPTADMIFSVAQIVAFISEAITLEPGDLVLTGTPAGVGIFRDPELLLAPGDEVTVEIEGIGTLTNPVTA